MSDHAGLMCLAILCVVHWISTLIYCCVNDSLLLRMEWRLRSLERRGECGDGCCGIGQESD